MRQNVEEIHCSILHYENYMLMSLLVLDQRYEFLFNQNYIKYQSDIELSFNSQSHIFFLGQGKSHHYCIFYILYFANLFSSRGKDNTIKEDIIHSTIITNTKLEQCLLRFLYVALSNAISRANLC